MGGLVARALLTLKNFKQELINLLVTQATPHVAPVMPLDRFITGENPVCCTEEGAGPWRFPAERAWRHPRVTLLSCTADSSCDRVSCLPA